MSDNDDRFESSSNGLTQADCVFWEDSNNNDDLQSLNDSPFDAKVKESPFGLTDEADDDGIARAHRNTKSLKSTGMNSTKQENSSEEHVDEENRYGVVHARKRRRTKRLGLAGVPPSSAKAVQNTRRLSTGSNTPGVNFALANLLEQMATPAARKSLDSSNHPSFPRSEPTLGHSSATSESPISLQASSSRDSPPIEDDEDEFGTFDLDIDELAQIDSMVAATQADPGNSRKEVSHQDSDPKNSLKEDIAPKSRTSETGLSRQSQFLKSSSDTTAPLKGVHSSDETRIPLEPSLVHNHIQRAITNDRHGVNQAEPSMHGVQAIIPSKPEDAEIVDDEFDFPDDIDFEALDKSIAERTSSSQIALPQSIMEMSETHFANLLPGVNGRISNMLSNKSSLTQPGLDFTRYKIIHVRSHGQSFTKVLEVSVWRNEMADSSQETHQSTNPNADGLVFLQGEWFHSELSGGEIIHLCSLSGQFSTGPEALPIYLHTSPARGCSIDDLVLVVHPDLLLTPTTISETVTCTRRALLKNRIGSTGLTSPAPLYGTMRHELFQACLRANDFSNSFINSQIRKILRDNAEGLLSCGVSTREAELEIQKVVPQVHSFVELYTQTGKKHNSPFGETGQLKRHGTYPAVNFLVQNIEFIEESIVSHELGLKGAVDIVVKAKLQEVGSSVEPKTSLVSIELKTSHMQNAHASHCCQLALYVVMLHTRYGPTVDGNKTGSGALLYMNNKSLHAIHVAPFITEIKSLMGQRNVVAIEQSRASQPRGVKVDPSCGPTLMEPAPPVLLPAIEGSAPCKRCYTNKECMMYAATESRYHGKENVVLQQHKELFLRVTGHLSTADFEYFQKWDRLIDLEALHSTAGIAKAWLISSEERERNTGRCISNLVYVMQESQEAPADSTTVLCFRRSGISTLSTAFHDLEFESGSHAVLSTDTATFIPGQKEPSHMHIVRGVIHRVTEDKVFLLASHDDLARMNKVVSAKRVGACFRLDRDEVATGVGTLRQNLINLFAAPSGENSEVDPKFQRTSNLRRMLINLEAPKFDMDVAQMMFYHSHGMPKFGVPGCDLDDLAIEYCELNPDQQRAAEMVMACQDYALIQGLPGTGKTSTVAFLVRLLLAHGKRVLITSYTHSAVDNVLLKLLESGVAEESRQGTQPLVRIARASSCHDRIMPYLANNIASELEPTGSSPSAENLKKTMESARVVGVSALSIPRSALLAQESFDVVIVDEAGQISQPAIIGALRAAKKFVLVGDHKQLPPLVQSELADSGGSSESMMKRLAEAHPQAVSQLSLQYRMAQGICDLSNDISYKGDLKCANKAIGDQQLALSRDAKDLSGPDWVKTAVAPARVALFIDTDALRADDKTLTTAFERKSCSGRGSVVNHTELQVVKSLVQTFVHLGVSLKSIGVICPFRAQLQLIGKDSTMSDFKKAGLELSTIDRYQGRDKDVIILSMVRSNESGKVGRLLSDARRLNVSVTRAKKKLVIVGSFSTLYKGSRAIRPALDRLKLNKCVVTYQQ